VYRFLKLYSCIGGQFVDNLDSRLYQQCQLTMHTTSFLFSGDQRRVILAAMASFVEYTPETDFPIENIPFGVFSTAAEVRFCAPSPPLSLCALSLC
jgi:hypothetical protein